MSETYTKKDIESIRNRNKALTSIPQWGLLYILLCGIAYRVAKNYNIRLSDKLMGSRATKVSIFIGVYGLIMILILSLMNKFGKTEGKSIPPKGETDIGISMWRDISYRIPFYMYTFTFFILWFLLILSFVRKESGESTINTGILSFFLLFLMINQYYINYLYSSCSNGLNKSSYAKSMNSSWLSGAILSSTGSIILVLTMMNYYSNPQVPTPRTGAMVMFIAILTFIIFVIIKKLKGDNPLEKMINTRLQCDGNMDLDENGKCESYII